MPISITNAIYLSGTNICGITRYLHIQLSYEVMQVCVRIMLWIYELTLVHKYTTLLYIPHEGTHTLAISC